MKCIKFTPPTGLLIAPLAAEIRRIRVAPGDEVAAGTELLALNSREIFGWQTQLKTAQQDQQVSRERSHKLEQIHTALLKIKNEEIAQVEQELRFRYKHTETVRDFVRRAEILATNGLISQVELLRNQLELAEVEKDLLLGDERHFVAQADLETPTIQAGAQSQKLRIGMKGEARVSVGHCTMVEYAFEPICQLRENLRR